MLDSFEGALLHPAPPLYLVGDSARFVVYRVVICGF